MILDLNNAFSNEGQSFNFECEFKIDRNLLNEGFRLVDKLSVIKGNYTFAGDKVRVIAKFSFKASSPCDRCLKPTVVSVNCELDEEFSENNEEEGYSFENYKLDLTQAVNDSILFSLPNKVLCKSSCKGLCAVCGGNLNENSCKCVQPSEQAKDALNPFAVLKDIN